MDPKPPRGADREHDLWTGAEGSVCVECGEATIPGWPALGAVCVPPTCMVCCTVHWRGEGCPPVAEWVDP